LNDLGLPGGIAGHVGDGNYHILLMINMDNEEEVEKAKTLNERIVKYALARGGTCTGEHGVGIGKQKYQQEEHGEALHAMEKINKKVDHIAILNPNIFVKHVK